MAISGETSVVCAVWSRDATDAKALFIGGIPTVGCRVHNLDIILLRGCRRRMLGKRGNKASSASAGACASICTPSPALSTHPQMPCAMASRYNKRSYANALHNARHMNMHMPHAIPSSKPTKRTGLFW